MKPLSVQNAIDIKDRRLDGSAVLWAAIIDEDFLVEVHRENYCNGKLHIFEILDGLLIHIFAQNVPVKCVTLNWPDSSYIARWRNIATIYIDNFSD